MDIIYLHGLKVDCVIGVWEWEKQITQTVTIDLDMGFDISVAAKSDHLQDTLSYKQVSKRVESLAKESRCALVEKLAAEIANMLLADFSIQWCRVKINKFGAVRAAGDVGVIIERGAMDINGKDINGGDINSGDIDSGDINGKDIDSGDINGRDIGSGE